MKKSKQISYVSTERVSSDYSAGLFKDAFDERLQHRETSRLIKQVIEEHVGSHEFVVKIKQYATEALEDKLLRSGKYWITLITTTALTAALSSLVTYLISQQLQ